MDLHWIKGLQVVCVGHLQTLCNGKMDQCRITARKAKSAASNPQNMGTYVGKVRLYKVVWKTWFAKQNRNSGTSSKHLMNPCSTRIPVYLSRFL